MKRPMFMQVVIWHFLFLLGITHVICLFPSKTCSDLFEPMVHDRRDLLTGKVCGSCLRAQKLQPREVILTPALLPSVRLCQVVSCRDWPRALVINKMDVVLLRGTGSLSE